MLISLAKLEKECVMEEQTYAVPFALVGFFLTSKPIEESIRNDVAPEELKSFRRS